LAGISRHRKAATIEVGRIVPDPAQPRQEFDPAALDNLARSLAERGQLMPIRVRWDEAMGQYKIVAGERRWRAAVQAGLTTLECVISDRPQTADEVLEEQLIENCVREDLKPIEQARAFRLLMDRLGLSFRELADRLHLSHAAVHRAVSLLDTPEPVQEMVATGTLPPSAAYEISKLDRPEDQVAIAQTAAEQKMTRDQVVEAVKARKAGRSSTPSPSRREFKLPNGDKVGVTVASGNSRMEAVVAALKAAIKLAQSEIKATPPGRAA
jgi:ParB family chromosome partitioning protein